MTKTRKPERPLQNNDLRGSITNSVTNSVSNNEEQNTEDEIHEMIKPLNLFQLILENTSLSLENKGAVARDHVSITNYSLV